MWLRLDCATTTSPTVATSSVQIIGSNYNRKSVMLYNNSSNSCYINFGPTASSAACSVIVASFTTWMWPVAEACYIGPISAIRNAGTGTIIVTEFSQNSQG